MSDAPCKPLGPDQVALGARLHELNDALLVVDPENRRVRLSNRAAQEILGWSEEDLLGRAFDSLIVPIARTQVLTNFSNVAAARAPDRPNAPEFART